MGLDLARIGGQRDVQHGDVAGPVGRHEERPHLSVDLPGRQHRCAIGREAPVAEGEHRSRGDAHDVLAVRVGDEQRGSLAGAPEEGDLRAVSREDRSGVRLRTGHDGRRLPGRRVHGVDVAGVRVGDQAVGRRAVWHRGVTLGPGHDGDDRPDQQGDQSQHADGAPGKPRTRRGRRRDVHGKPPFGERPGRPLANVRQVAEEGVIEIVRPVLRGQVGQSSREIAFGVTNGGHAICPPGAADPGSTVSSTLMRIARSDRCRRDLAVPDGMPRQAATSGSGMPR
jgi:hypothetical protein